MTPVLSCCRALAIPKSINFSFPPTKRKLAGFKSEWIIPVNVNECYMSLEFFGNTATKDSQNFQNTGKA